MTQRRHGPDVPLLLLKRLARDQRGVSLIVTACAMVALLGFAGLAIDVGKWLNEARSTQAAADQGAYSAATAAGSLGCPNDPAVKQATAIVASYGYVDDRNGATVEIQCNASNSTFKVTVKQKEPLWFSRLFLTTAPTVVGQATAQLGGKASDLCVLAMDGTNPSEGYIGTDDNALYLGGSTKVDIACGIAVNSRSANSLAAGSNASSISATDIYLVGDHTNSNGFTPSITATGCSTCDPPIAPNSILTYQRPIRDPYANRIVPDHSCATTAMQSFKNATISPGTYCGGLSLDGNITVKCGTYIIAGGSLTNQSGNSKVTQDPSCTTGVTFILTNSSPGATDYATLKYTGDMELTAPTSGPYGGMVFFQDRNAPNPNTSGGNTNNTQCGSGSAQNKISGGSSQVITGAIYFPAQVLCFSGGSRSNNANKCTQLIAFNLAFVGSAGLNSNCAGVGIANMNVTTPQLIQ